MKKRPVTDRVQTVALASVLTALTALLTLFPRIPIPGAAGGYVHLGDLCIYVAACVLPTSFAAVSAGIGGVLADVISGGAAWAPWTFFIKALMTLAFTSRSEKLLCRRNVISTLPALVINVAGYFAAESVMYSPAGAVPGLLWNAAQSAVSAAAFIALAAALDAAGVKKKYRSSIREKPE